LTKISSVDVTKIGCVAFGKVVSTSNT